MEEKWTYETDDQVYPPRQIQSSAPYPDGVDWEDDSGAIHTVKHTYKVTKEDGWQDNRVYQSRMEDEERGRRVRKMKGTQVNMTYETDDYRIVIPVLIGIALIMTAVCVVMTILIPAFGIFFDVMWVLAVIGIIRQRPDKKWRNQAKRRKEEKENTAYRE